MTLKKGSERVGFKLPRILLALGIIILLVFAALILGAVVPLGTGISASPPESEAPPYAARGPYAVGTRAFVIDREATLEVMLWYPSGEDVSPDERISYPYQIKIGAPLGKVTLARFNGQGLRDAEFDLTAGPFPLVVLSPGLSIAGPAYAWLAEHLASYGMVVIAPEHEDQFDPELNMLWQTAVTRPADIHALLAYIDQESAAGGSLEGLADTDSVAMVGHSYGGYTALVEGGAQIDTAGFATRCENTAADDPGAWLYGQILPHRG